MVATVLLASSREEVWLVVAYNQSDSHNTVNLLVLSAHYLVCGACIDDWLVGIEVSCQVDLMTSPPKPADPSYRLFDQERKQQLASLRRRGEKLNAALNSLTGVTLDTDVAAADAGIGDRSVATLRRRQCMLSRRSNYPLRL